MITLTDEKAKAENGKKMYFMIVEWNVEKVIEKDDVVFPIDMFPRDSNGDCAVDDIDECMRRMTEWINKDPAKNRMAIMRKLEKFTHLNKECHIFAEPYNVLMSRNEERERRVPEDVIWRMIRGFEMPTRAEGYNRIVVHNTVPIKTEPMIDETVGFDQCNHHHSLTLYGHCKTAKDYIAEKVVTDNWNKLQNLADAAFFHDFGKLDTQTFFNAKGIETIEAHYYDHHGVGAYWALMYDEPWDELDRIYIAQLICYHMQPYFNKTEAARRRWKEIWGDELNDMKRILCLDVETGKVETAFTRNVGEVFEAEGITVYADENGDPVFCVLDRGESRKSSNLTFYAIS